MNVKIKYDLLFDMLADMIFDPLFMLLTIIVVIYIFTFSFEIDSHSLLLDKYKIKSKRQFCNSLKKNGDICNNYQMNDEEYCYTHTPNKTQCNICFCYKGENSFILLHCKHKICKQCLYMSFLTHRKFRCPYCRKSYNYKIFL